jgi:polygalacturonase
MSDLVADLRAAAHPRARAAVLQSRIDALSHAGGGVLAVPPGIWVTTRIELRSGVCLRLVQGCVLRAHTVIEDYPDQGVYSGSKDRQGLHLILARDCVHIAIEGPGVIDGQGPAFWDEPLERQIAAGKDVRDLLARRPFQVAYPKWWIEKARRISPLIEIHACRDVRLDRLHITDSPGWTVHTTCCDRVTIRGVTVANDLYGPNTDGFDINGCRDVVITGCNLTCGDDAIILKSTDDARPCERVVVSDCTLASNCAALGLGAESSHAIRDVAITNCAVRQALRIIQIEMWDPGLIEQVSFSNIVGATMTEHPLERPIYIDIQHHRRTDGRLGVCRGIAIANCAFTTRGRIVLTAADGAAIEDVRLAGIQMRYPGIEDATRTVPASRSDQMSNDSPQSRAINAALVGDNVHRLLVDDLRCTWAAGPDAPAYHAAWFRRSHGVLRAPFLTPSLPGHPAIVQDAASRMVVAS